MYRLLLQTGDTGDEKKNNIRYKDDRCSYLSSLYIRVADVWMQMVGGMSDCSSYSCSLVAVRSLLWVRLDIGLWR